MQGKAVAASKRAAPVFQTHQGIEAAALPGALLTPRTTCAVVGFSMATIRRKMAGPEKFPQPLRLGTRCLRWRSSEVAEWVASQGNNDPKAPPALKPKPQPTKRKARALEAV